MIGNLATSSLVGGGNDSTMRMPRRKRVNRRERVGWLTLALMATTFSVAACGCGGSTSINTQHSTTTLPDSAQGSTESSGTSGPSATAAGIIVLTSTNSSCTVNSVDPSSGAMTAVATFPVSSAGTNCRDSQPEAPLVYSSNFDRLAMTKGVDDGARAGWITPGGDFVQVGPSSATPDFGDKTRINAIGFDKLDNFYYRVDVGIELSGNEHSEYYRTPAGSTTAGELIGTSDDEERIFGRLPGGLLGFGAEESVFSGCSLHNPMSGDFDPDQPNNFHAKKGQVFRSDKWCSNSGDPITPNGNSPVLHLAASPDGSQVAFKTNTSKLFVVGTSGSDKPRQIEVADLKGLGGTGWVIRAWR